MSTDSNAPTYLTAEYADLHSFRMDYAALLRVMMDVGKFNQAHLAKRLRVTQPTVSRWLKATRPKLDQHQRIIAEARRLGLLEHPYGFLDEGASFEAEAPDESVPLTVKVVGYVGAGAATHRYATGHGGLDDVPAPKGATPETVAVEIRGDSLGELFDRWLVFYDDVRRPVSLDLIGRLCVVGLSDDRVLIKKIGRGANGLYDLHSNVEEPIKGVAIDWAARVKQMVPR